MHELVVVVEVVVSYTKTMQRHSAIVGTCKDLWSCSVYSYCADAHEQRRSKNRRDVTVA